MAENSTPAQVVEVWRAPHDAGALPIDALRVLASADAFDEYGERAPAVLGELAVDKTTAGESPHPFARVIVLRLLGGKRVWEGFADEQGRWQAEGLQPGLEYVAVGIDTKRIFKATAAGPVMATVPADDATGGGNG